MPNLLDSIQTGDNLIFGLIGHIFKTSTNPIYRNDDNKKKFMMALLVAALFLVVATEPFKLVLRKNIGKQVLSLPGVILVSILYLLWAVIIGWLIYDFNYMHEISEYSVYMQYLFNKYILLSGLICYLIIAIFVMLRGIAEYSRSQADKNDEPKYVLYRGESLFMGQLSRQGVSQAKIWSESEPKACFKFGGIITLLHPIIGLPILLSSLSFWVNEWYHVHFNWSKLQELQNFSNEPHPSEYFAN